MSAMEELKKSNVLVLELRFVSAEGELYPLGPHSVYVDYDTDRVVLTLYFDDWLEEEIEGFLEALDEQTNNSLLSVDATAIYTETPTVEVKKFHLGPEDVESVSLEAVNFEEW